MSINYTSVVGVGVNEEEITYRSLTERSKAIIQDIYIDSLSQEYFYDEDDMLSVGETGIVADIIPDDVIIPAHVLLEGGEFFDIRDLEAVEDTKEKSIGNLTVNISTEDKQEVAKDILKIILEDLNSVITNVIKSLSEVGCGEVGEGVNSESILTVGKSDEDVLSNLLLLINNAAENRDHQTVDVLTKAYQRIKIVQTI